MKNKQMTVKRSDFEMEQMIDDNADTSYLEQEAFEARLGEYQNGDFYYIGIRASVTLEIPHGSNGTRILQKIESPGLWGIESDSDKDYLQEIYAEECNILADMLQTMGMKVTA